MFFNHKSKKPRFNPKKNTALNKPAKPQKKAHNAKKPLKIIVAMCFSKPKQKIQHKPGFETFDTVIGFITFDKNQFCYQVGFSTEH